MIHSSKAQVTAKTQAQPTGAFMPVPPVQAKVSSTPAAMPAWEPTASEHQAAPPTSLASLFGHAPSPAASLPIQAKLTVGAVGDPYEQEADRVASQVVKAINSPADTSLQPQAERAIAEVQRQPIVTLQRTATTSILQRMGQAGGNVPEDVETKIQQAKGSGQTLDAGLQSKMGQAMGVDFSSVKVHTDTQSHQLNRAVQAKAFTTGSDVFFGQGQYNPGSQSGQELIAHELTHVVQQGQAVQRTLAPEKEAQLETVMQEDEKLQQKPDSAVQRTLAPDKEAQLEAMGEDEKLQQKPDSPIQRTPNDTIQRINMTATPTQGDVIQRGGSSTLTKAKGDTGGTITATTRKGVFSAQLTDNEKKLLSNHVKNARARSAVAVNKMAQLRTALATQTLEQVDYDLKEAFVDEFVGDKEKNQATIQGLANQAHQALTRTQAGLAGDIKIVENREGSADSTLGYVKTGIQDKDANTQMVDVQQNDAVYDPNKEIKSVPESKYDVKKHVQIDLPFLGPARPSSMHIQFGKYLSRVGKAAADHTIIHEATHKFVNTKDHKYGQGHAKQGQLTPQQAIENADSYAYYAMNC